MSEPLPKCPKCGRKHAIRSGQVQGRQRWKCKVCQFQFTRTSRRGRPLWQKSLVVFLYAHGMSLQAIASLLAVQPSTVLKWVRAYEKDYAASARGQTEVAILDLDTMRAHLAKRSSRGTARLWIAIDNIPLEKSLGISIAHTSPGGKAATGA